MIRGRAVRWELALVLVLAVAAGFLTEWLMAREQGWRAAYYPTSKLTGTPVYRVDSAVDFDWGLRPPLAGYVDNRFSARWDTCLMLPRRQSVAFRLGSDDGSRLYVDGELLIDNWRPQPLRWEAGAKVLEAGSHHLRVEYFDSGGPAEVFLEVFRGEADVRVHPQWFVVPERRWRSLARFQRPAEYPDVQPPRLCEGLIVSPRLSHDTAEVSEPRDLTHRLSNRESSVTHSESRESFEGRPPSKGVHCDIGVVYREKEEIKGFLDYGRNGKMDATFGFAPAEAEAEAEVLIGRWRGPEAGPAVTQPIGEKRKFFFDDDGDRKFERSFEFGSVDDSIIIGDFDGDGMDEVGLVSKKGNNAKWFLDHGDGGAPELSFEFGRASDTPIVGSWDGGDDDHVGVVREDDGVLRWFLDTNHDSLWDIALAFGQSGDRVVVGDWNADGVTDVGVIRLVDGDLKWFLDYNTPTERGMKPEKFFAFGVAGDRPIVCDWDADGDDDAGVVRVRDDRLWFLLDLDDAGKVSEAVIPSGRAENATPIVGDWDGR